VADKEPLTYKASGVDIEAADRAVEAIKRLVQSTYTPGVKAGVGGFGAVYSLGPTAGDELLVAATDGVGTKLKLAFALNKHDTVGIDLVAMSANDVLTLGARPAFMLDYIACGKLEAGVIESVVAGIVAGCKQAGCALIGGEIAEMPGFYAEGEYDLAGFVVGTVKQDELVDGKAVRPGDYALGLPSVGLHSNGYSLARKALLERAGYKLEQTLPELGCTLGEELLRPTRIYVQPVQAALAAGGITGMAHITGGGLPGNLVRILPEGTALRLRKSALPKLPVFDLIADAGQVPEAELYRTFNMGTGFVLLVRPEALAQVKAALVSAGEAPFELGEVIKSDTKCVELV